MKCFKLLLSLTLLIASITAARQAPAKPNILLILADDMGYSDLGCYGGEIQTPNLDALAAHGLRFTQFYNTARCWPSRAAILTGYYAQQVRRDTIPGVTPSGANGTRPPWAHLLPDMLKPLGYRTYHSGKWHLDGLSLKNGFDHSYRLEDHNHNFAPKDHFLDDVKLPPVDPASGYYSTTFIAQHCIDCLKEHAASHPNEPFFSYLAFTSPHFPLQAPPQDIAKYHGRYAEGWDVIRRQRWERQRSMNLVDWSLPDRDPAIIPSWNAKEADLQKRIGPGEVGHAVAWDSLTDEQKRFQSAKMEIHAAMVDRIDQEVGRVIDQLKSMNQLDDTLILFLSDNGASAEQIIRGDGHDPTAPLGSARSFICLGPGWSTSCNTPLRLHKSWVHEGGISTSFIVHWPNGIAARNELRHNPAHLIDFAPTILDLAGGHWPQQWANTPVPPPPGKSLVPVFTRDGSVTHDYFWWFHENNRALRVGDWKLVSAGKDGPWELYDLSKDRGESHNLANEHPEKVSDLSALWQKKLDEFTALARKP
jgi:arylsulfatase